MRADIAEDEGAGGKRDEDRWHVGIGDEEAVQQTDGEHAAEHQRQRRLVGHSTVEELQVPGHGHGHDRHHRQIDAAPDDDHRHTERKDAEDGDRANDGDQVRGCQESRKPERRGGEENDADSEYDVLLVEGSEEAPTCPCPSPPHSPVTAGRHEPACLTSAWDQPIFDAKIKPVSAADWPCRSWPCDDPRCIPNAGGHPDGTASRPLRPSGSGLVSEEVRPHRREVTPHRAASPVRVAADEALQHRKVLRAVANTSFL